MSCEEGFLEVFLFIVGFGISVRVVVVGLGVL